METETPVCQTGKTGREAGARAAKKTAASRNHHETVVQGGPPPCIYPDYRGAVPAVFISCRRFSSLIPMLGSGLANAISGTSYASADSDLLGTDEDYTALENDLKQKIANIERTHSGYDEHSLQRGRNRPQPL